MRQIRNSVFETNSSSTHSVSIRHMESGIGIIDVESDNKVHITFGEFGWEVDSYNDARTKLSYLVTMVAQFANLDIWCSSPWDEDTLNETLMDSEDFRTLNATISERCDCNGIWVDRSEGYIDHQSCEYYNCIQDFIDDWRIDSVEDFIFNANVILHTDNDNH